MDERKKYEQIWQHPDYRRVSPAETVFGFIETQFTGVGMLIDFGCGTGRALRRLRQTSRFNVVGVDIAYNCLDEDVQGCFPFVVSAIEDLPRCLLRCDYSICIDVLEHLPFEEVDTAIARIHEATERKAIIRVANFEENHGGPLIGMPLHLSLMDAHRWDAMLARRFRKVHRVLLDEDTAPERYTFVCDV